MNRRERREGTILRRHAACSRANSLLHQVSPLRLGFVSQPEGPGGTLDTTLYEVYLYLLRR